MFSWATASWGGEGESVIVLRGDILYTARPPKNQVWRPQNVGLVWSVPISYKGYERRGGGGGQTYSTCIAIFGEASYDMFPPP